MKLKFKKPRLESAWPQEEREGKYQKITLRIERGNCPGCPVVKSPPSNAGDTVPFLVGELGSHVPPSN